MSTKRITKTSGIIPYIIEVMCLRLKEHEALNYLKERGYDVSHTEYYSLRNEVKETADSRLNIIGLDFAAQHLSRIDNLNTIESELWGNYHAEQNPTNKAKILMHIANMQEILAAFYDSSRWVLEQSAKLNKQQKQI